MRLKTKLLNTVYEFKDLKEVLGKANEERSGDSLVGLCAETSKERVAAKEVLANLTIADIRNNPVVSYEEDEVTRIIQDQVNERIYDEIKNWTMSDFREWILSNHTTGEMIKRVSRGITSEVVAGVCKLMSNLDLIYAASKIRITAHCNTTIGKEGTLSFRLQPNHPTDDVDGIIVSTMEGLSYGVGDAVIGGLNYAEQKKTNEKNLALQREQYEYQKQLQKEIFAREDSATQRKVQDLVKSGLNPLLAGGGGASAGSSVGMVQMGGQQAPQMNMNMQGAVDNIYNALKSSQEITTSKAQRALINAQIASEISKAANIAEDTKIKEQEYIEKVYNYKKYKGLNLPIGFSANSPYSAAQGALFMAENSALGLQEAEKKAEQIEKEAHETWSKEQNQKEKEKQHTSKYIYDPNMPYGAFY